MMFVSYGIFVPFIFNEMAVFPPTNETKIVGCAGFLIFAIAEVQGVSAKILRAQYYGTTQMVLADAVI
jgi:hypothetical protein